jgi:hypothetical protein
MLRACAATSSVSQHLGRDRSVLGQQRRDPSSGLDDVLLGATLNLHHLEPGALQDMMLYVYVPIVEIRYEHFQDLITTLSWPSTLGGSFLPRRLVSHCPLRLPPPDFLPQV